MGERFKSIRIRRLCISIIEISFNLNILKEKNLSSSLFLCCILGKCICFLKGLFKFILDK